VLNGHVPCGAEETLASPVSTLPLVLVVDCRRASPQARFVAVL